MMKYQPPEREKSIEETIRRHSDMVYRLAYARTGATYDADEIYQEVFLRYIRKKPDFQSESHERAWFIRVTVNCANNLWRSPWRKRTEPLDESLTGQSAQPIDLSCALQSLPGRYREVIHLFYYEDLSVQEISAVLRRKPSTVRTQLTRARALLKKQLKEEHYEF